MFFAMLSVTTIANSVTSPVANVAVNVTSPAPIAAIVPAALSTATTPSLLVVQVISSKLLP